MQNSPRRELVLVAGGFALLTVALTFPLAVHPGSLSYKITSNLDGQFSVWNVAWVARALVVTPLHVFDANIFYPHRWTLAYSEANLGAGALAAPAYWATRNVYIAHASVFLLSFVLAGTGMYYLVRYLIGDRRAALISAIGFAYCPYIFAHLPHIQLLMTAGLPFCLLAFHRLADRPSAGRGIVLGAVMGVQAYFCAYYAVFAVPLVGFAVIFIAASRRLWRNAAYWKAVMVAATVATASVSPLLGVYVLIRQTTGFTRSVEAAESFTAVWRSYFASSAHAHVWMLGFLQGPLGDVLFPGFVMSTFGLAGFVIGWLAGHRRRELALLYGSVAALACWESFGPAAGLYRLTYAAVPGFSFLRVPSRFGLLVVLSLAVLAGIAIARLLENVSRATIVAGLLVLLTTGELIEPLQFTPVPSPEPAYEQLAKFPYGAVLELPVYSEKFAFIRSRYMLSSTIHWMPLVDAYSDYIPQDFRDSADVLGEFPTRDALKRLQAEGVPYAVIHVSDYNGEQGTTLRERLNEFAPYLDRVYADDRIWLYRITGSPP